jgi:hypothetical protein
VRTKALPGADAVAQIVGTLAPDDERAPTSADRDDVTLVLADVELPGT